MHTLIAHDHELIRFGTKVLLKSRYPDMTFSDASCIEEALSCAPGLRVDLILLNVCMPSSRDLEALTAVINAFRTVPVVILSAETITKIINQTYLCGASAFAQESKTDLLMAAVEAAVAGRQVEFHSDSKLSQSAHPIQATSSTTVGIFDFLPEELSERHAAVMECVHAGKGNKSIARDLNLSVSTVKNYLSKVFEVFDVNSRTAALAVYLRLKEERLRNQR